MKVKKKVKIRKKQEESIKNREWERERRGKLNVAFVQLDSLLPDHDPSRPRSKVATLLAAIGHIRHLAQLNATLIGGGGGQGPGAGPGQRDSLYVAELAKLHERIDALRNRCQQLAQLLQMADIPVPAPRKVVAQPVAATTQPKWNGNIAHKTVQRRIISSRKDKAEKKENKELLEVGSTAAKKKKKKNIQAKANTTKPVESKDEPTAPGVAAEDESSYLSPLKKVIDLCTTPLRELTGFTLNSASVAASSSSSPSSSSSSISSPSSSLSSNSPSCSTMPGTPTNTNNQNLLLVAESAISSETVMTSSAGDVVKATNDLMSSDRDVVIVTKDVMSSDKDVKATKDVMSSAGDVVKTTKDVTSSAGDVTIATKNAQATVVANSSQPSLELVGGSLVASQPSETSCSSLSVATKSSSSSSSSSTVLASPSSVLSMEEKQNSSTSKPAIVSNKPSSVSKKSTSKSKPKMATPLVGTGSKPLPVTGTVHVVKGMNPYPSIMPVTVTNTGLNFAPAVNQSIMLVLPDGRLVSVPRQQPVQSQFVFNRTINHQQPTTIVIGNSAPVIEPIVVETIGGRSVEGIAVNRANGQKIGGALQQQRVLLSKHANKLPIPMVGRQFVVRRGVDMHVKEKRVIRKCQKSKRAKKTNIPGDAIMKKDVKHVNIPKDTTTKDEVKSSEERKVEDPSTEASSKYSHVDKKDASNADSNSVVFKNLGEQKELSVEKCGSNVPAIEGQTSSGNSITDSPMENAATEPVLEGAISSIIQESDSLLGNLEQKNGLEAEIQENIGIKDDNLEKITNDGRLDVVDLIKNSQKEGERGSAEKQVENLGDDDDFVLDAMSDDGIENDESDVSLIENRQRKRTADHDSIPALPEKKLKTSKHEYSSTEMNLACEEVLDEENFNMVAERLVNSNVDDVQMASVISDVPLQESFNKQDLSSGKEADMHQNHDTEKKTLESCTNKDDVFQNSKGNSTNQVCARENFPSSNSNFVLVKDLLPLIDKGCDNESDTYKQGKIVSSVVSDQNMEVKLTETSDPTKKTVESSLSVDTFATSKNPNNNHTAFEAELEKVIANKCDEQMVTDVSSEKILVQPCSKISDVSPTNSSEILCLDPVAEFDKLPTSTIFDHSAEVNQMFTVPTTSTEQNAKCPSYHDTNVDGVSCTSNASTYPISTSNPISGNAVINEVQELNISPGGALKESIKSSCFSTLTNIPETVSNIHKTIENDFENSVKDTETSRSSLPSASKQCSRISENAATDATTKKQNTPPTITTERQTSVESGNNNFVMETLSMQIGKPSFVGDKQQKIETQIQFNKNKIDVNNFETTQKIGVNNVFDSICPENNEPSVSTFAANCSKTQDVSNAFVGSSFNTSMITVSSNHTNSGTTGGLLESKNMFWNNDIAEQIGGNSASMYANQNLMNSSKSDPSKSSGHALASSFMSLDTNSVCTFTSSVSSNSTSITPSSSAIKPSIMTQQRPIVSYKVNDNGQKTVNPTVGSNIASASSTTKWISNSKATCPESTNFKVGNTNASNYLQSGYVPAVRQCNNCDNYSHLVDNFIEPSGVHECHHHHQKFQKPFQTKTVANTSKTIQTGDMSKNTSMYNSNTKIIGNKIKKDIATNTASEPKVLYSSQTYFGNSHDTSSIARKQLEAINGNKDRVSNINNKTKDSALNKNVRKVMKKTVSQQTDEVSHQGLAKGVSTTARKCEMRRVGGYKMKSTSSCQTVESTPINSAEKISQRNSFGGTVLAQSNEKSSTFQAGSNVGLVQNNNKPSTFQVSNSAGLVAQNVRNPAAASMSDGSSQQNHMEFMSLVPKSTNNSLVTVQHSKPVEKQASTFANRPQNVKKLDYKLPPQISKEKNVFLDDIRLALPNSDFSNDMFSTLQVPSGSQHHGSLSPTAAFLDAFPLVSNSKNSEMLIDSDVHHTTETMLQLGDTTNNCSTTNIMDTNTGRQPNQNCLQALTYNSNNNNSGTEIGMNVGEINKNPCNKNNNGMLGSQIKSGNTASNSLANQEAQPSHSITGLNTKTTHTNLEKCTGQTSKIQDYQSHYNVQYDYLSANSFQNYNYNSNYKKVVPKFPDSNYANVASNNTGFANNSQPYRATNYGQTNEEGSNYNTSIYSNWNSKPTMQLQNFDDFQTNYMSSYNHFPTSSAPKNVFTSDPSFSTSSTVFGTTYKNMDTNVVNVSNSNVFVSQTPPAASSNKKIGGKSSNNDLAASFIYTQASTTSNPVTARSYSCVFSSASDYQTSVGFPQPLYSSSNICAIDDTLNTPKASSVRDPVLCSSTLASSGIVTQSVPVLTTKSATCITPKNISSNKFYLGVNSSGKKQPAMFDNNLNKTNQNSAMDQSNVTTSKPSSYFLSLPTTSSNFNNYSNNTNALFTGPTASHNYQNSSVFGSSSGATTTTTLANSKVGSSESVKTSTTSSSTSQPRMPVNWMTMPDPRTSTLEASSSASTYIPPDRMFTPHKDVLDFIAPIITGCGNLQTTYSGISNNSQMFYGLDLPSDGQQQCMDISNALCNKMTSSAANHQTSSSLHYSWPTSKSSLSLLSHLDNHGLGIPSTLPTLVGDLALGTNTGPSTPAADGAFRGSSNTTATIFQTMSEGEDRSNRLPSKSSNFLDVPSKSSNYSLNVSEKSSNFLDVPSKSSNYSLDVSAKSSNFLDVAPSKPSNFLDVPAKSSNYSIDASAKSSNYPLAAKSSDFSLDVPSKSSNFLDVPSKSSNLSMHVQPNSTMLQFERTNLLNDTKKPDNFKGGKSQGQNQGQRFSAVDSSKASTTNPSQQQNQSGGSFLSVSQLVDEVKTDKKRDNKNSGNTYKYIQNIAPSEIYYPESNSNSKQSGYNSGAVQHKGVANNFNLPMNVKSATNSNNVQSQNRNSYNLLSFDGGTTNQKPNLLSFDGGTTNQKPNSLSFDGGTTNQKPNLLSFDGGTTNQKPNLMSFDGGATNQKPNLLSFDGGATNQKPKSVSTPQKAVTNIANRKPESTSGGALAQTNYSGLNTLFMSTNSTLPIPVSMTSTASLWPQNSNNCSNNNSCSTMKKTDGFSTRTSSSYKVSNKYSAESLISTDPTADHFTSSASHYGTCYEATSHNMTDVPLSSASHFGTTSLFASDYHHGDYGMQNNQPMPSYQNYFGQTLDNLQPNPPGSTTLLADNSADFQMNSFDSTAPYLFPAPSVPPPLNKKFTNSNNMAGAEPKPINKTSKPANNFIPASTGVFFPPTTMPLAPPPSSTTSANQQPANHRYQKSNLNFPPLPNCSSAANLPSSLSSASSTTNSLANFNMSTIFPEMNDKVDGGGTHHRPPHHVTNMPPPPVPPPSQAPPPAPQQQAGGADR